LTTPKHDTDAAKPLYEQVSQPTQPESLVFEQRMQVLLLTKNCVEEQLMQVGAEPLPVLLQT
jgi:hypothetical protein